jgi:hypothetical protein
LANVDKKTFEETKIQPYPWAGTPDDFDDNKSNKSGLSSNLRSISIAKPSIRMDIITADDFHKGIMEKQSPKYLKRW